jgi:hypothetical protein
VEEFFRNEGSNAGLVIYDQNAGHNRSVPSILFCTQTQNVKTKSPDTKANPIFRYVGVKGVGSGLLDESIALAKQGLPPAKPNLPSTHFASIVKPEGSERYFICEILFNIS